MTQVLKAMLGEQNKAFFLIVRKSSSENYKGKATVKVRTCSHQMRAIRSLWWKGVDLITNKEISRK